SARFSSAPLLHRMPRVPRVPPPSRRLPYTTLFRSLGTVQDRGTQLRGLYAHVTVTATDLTGFLRANADNLIRVSAESRAPLEARSEEHTSELQSRENLVCRLLLENKNNAGRDTTLP